MNKLSLSFDVKDMNYTLLDHYRMYRFYRVAPRSNGYARSKALGHLLVTKLMSRSTNPFPVDYKHYLTFV